MDLLANILNTAVEHCDYISLLIIIGYIVFKQFYPSLMFIVFMKCLHLPYDKALQASKSLCLKSKVIDTNKKN